MNRHSVFGGYIAAAVLALASTASASAYASGRFADSTSRIGAAAEARAVSKAMSASYTHRVFDTNGDGVVSVLVPIAFGWSQVLQGAYGTLWTGQLWVHNGSAQDLMSLQPGGVCVPTGCTAQLPSGSFRHVQINSNHYDGGALLYIPLDIAPEIHMSARLLELSRSSQPNGVDIPVVAEDEFFSGPSSYLAIPVSRDNRVALRVYDPRLVRGSTVRVELLGPEGQLVAETTLSPGDDPIVPRTPPDPRRVQHYPHPGQAAILDVTREFPALVGFERFHIRVTPLTPGMEYWAFVSVTDNDTQSVMLITSQP